MSDKAFYTITNESFEREIYYIHDLEKYLSPLENRKVIEQFETKDINQAFLIKFYQKMFLKRPEYYDMAPFLFDTHRHCYIIFIHEDLKDRFFKVIRRINSRRCPKIDLVNRKKILPNSFYSLKETPLEISGDGYCMKVIINNKLGVYSESDHKYHCLSIIHPLEVVVARLNKIPAAGKKHMLNVVINKKE
jgi:hypothetical protein